MAQARACVVGTVSRHSFFPYYEGSPRAYTPEMLKQFESKAYTYNGQELTEYEASQVQRYHERQIRRWKRENLAMQAAGQDTGESAAKIKRWQDTQKDFLSQTGLKRQRDREQAYDFGAKEIARAEKAAKTVEKAVKPATINTNISSGEDIGVQHVTRLNIEKYQCVSEQITTDEVIITEERIQHIRDRHPNDFERYERYLKEIIDSPDYILEANRPHTAFLLKDIREVDERFQLILRLKVAEDPAGYKNSVITFLKTSEKKWNKYLRNKKILYRSE